MKTFVRPNALLRTRGSGISRYLTVALATGFSCLAIGFALAAPIAQPNPSPGSGGGDGGGKETVFEKFAGGYQGNCVLSANGISAFGRGDVFVRKGNAGGGLTLRTTISANGQTIQSSRFITFKKGKVSSRSILITAGMTQPGTGRGRATTKANYIRYRDFSTFQSNGMTQSVLISGNAKFFRKSARFTEVWSVSGQSLTFTFRVRPR